MEVIRISIENCYKLNISLNLSFVLIGIFIAILILLVTKNINGKKYKNRMIINEAKLNIGQGEITFKIDYSDIELAYEIWVEMSTRKIGLKIDYENDVIDELYNSWYAFFGLVRDKLKEIPGVKINNSKELINICIKVLNYGLRPHLTRWQARFKKWYSCEKEKSENFNKTPQELQREFDSYQELIDDMAKTNSTMIEFKECLYKIAFSAEKNRKG